MGTLRGCEISVWWGKHLRRETALVGSSKALYNSRFSPFVLRVPGWGRAPLSPSEPLQLPKWSPSASKFNGRYRPPATRADVTCKNSGTINWKLLSQKTPSLISNRLYKGSHTSTSVTLLVNIPAYSTIFPASVTAHWSIKGINPLFILLDDSGSVKSSVVYFRQ